VPRASGSTQDASFNDAIQHLEKAHEFLDVAIESLSLHRTNAAYSLAVHAAIQASDVICAIKLKKRSSSAAHNDAVDLLASVGTKEKGLAQKLKRLLANKTKAEYDPTPVSSTHADEAVRNAEQLVQHASILVAHAKSTMRRTNETP
jgi:HEPN domain